MRRLNKKGFVFHAEYLLVIVAVLTGILLARGPIQRAATSMLTHIVGEIDTMVGQISFLNQ